MVEGSGPELLNIARTGEQSACFQRNPHNSYMALKRHKESYNTELETRKRGM